MKLLTLLSHLASPPDVFSNHASSTRFRLYTPASYIEQTSYTYKSAGFDDMDFDMDEDADYNDETISVISGVNMTNDVDDGNGDEVFHMYVESEKLREVVVVVKGPERDTLKPPESPITKMKRSVPMIPIVPPTVPQIPQSSSEISVPMPTPQIPELVSASSIDGVRSSPSVICSPIRFLFLIFLFSGHRSRPALPRHTEHLHCTSNISSPPTTLTPSPQTSIH